MVGSLGDIVFEVTDKSIVTFKEWSRTTSARFAEHATTHGKPVMEFIGPALDKVSLSIKLVSYLMGGMTIEDEIAKLRDIVGQGKVLPLIIGEHPQGLFVLEDLQETSAHLTNKGRLKEVDLSLNLKEYVDDLHNQSS